MFALDNEFAVCLQDYGRLKKYARVPVTNELYEDVKQWLSEGNQFVELPVDFVPPKSDETKIAEAKQYLSSTDWYYARKMETGEEVPADVVTKRLEARVLINQLGEVL